MGVSLEQVSGAVIRQVSEHVFYVDKTYYNNARRTSGENLAPVTAFRETRDREGLLVINVPPEKLNPDEIRLINDLCDARDPERNAEVKKIVSGAIDTSMGNKDFQVVEFGGGYNLLPTKAASHHTIEIDPKIIENQRARGLSISTFEGMTEGTLRTDCPRVSPAIYSFHFMNPEHVQQISTVVSHNGFFMANCMKTHTQEARDSMKDAFAKAGMKVAVVAIDTEATASKLTNAEISLRKAYGPSAKTTGQNVREMRSASPMNNEFWVAAYDDAVLAKAVGQLERSIGKNRPKLEVWNTRVLEAV